MKISKSVFAKYSLVLLFSSILFTSCFSSDKVLPNEDSVITRNTGTGNITGIVLKNSDNSTIEDVEVLLINKGKSYTTKTKTDGSFSLNVEDVKRGEGYTIHFQSDSYENASRAFTLAMANLRADIGIVYLCSAEEGCPAGGGEGIEQIDSSSDVPLTGVNFTTTSDETMETVVSYTISLVLSKVNTKDVIVPFSVSGSATNPSDHNLSDSSITISAGETKAEISFSIVNDTTIEGNETIIVTMGKVENEEAGRQNVLTITIIDDDAYTVSFEAASSSVSEGSAATIKVLLNYSFSSDISIPFTVSGTATKVSDHDLNDGTLTITAGQLEGSISINTVADGDDSESDETILLTMGTPSPSEIVKGTRSVYTLTIRGTNTSISGKVIDGESSAALVGAIVSVQDSNLKTIIANTLTDGTFTLNSPNFNRNSSYNLTVKKNYYMESTSTNITITGENNSTGNISLTRGYGTIIGQIKNDTAYSSLEGVLVSASDGGGNLRSDITDAAGNFIITSASNEFLLGNTYTVSMSKADYFSKNTTVLMGSTGNNNVMGDPVHLLINASISGTISGTEDLNGVTVFTKDSQNNTVSTTTDASGNFTLSSSDFRRNIEYEISIIDTRDPSKYETQILNSPATQAGLNSMGTIALTKKSGSGHHVAGVIVDYTDSSIKIEGAWVRALDADSIQRTAYTDTNGEFDIIGNFVDTNTYTVEFSKDNYTGETDVSKDSYVVTIAGVPGETTTIAGNLILYPIMIKATIDGSVKDFPYSIKHSHEKFLTGKMGFTLSARDKEYTDINTASAFYIHTDNTACSSSCTNLIAALPALPDSFSHSSTIAVNGAKQGGSIMAGLATEGAGRGAGRNAAEYGLKNATLFHFYVSDTGSFTMTTTGSTDIKMYLYNSAGAEIENSEADGINESITHTINSTGWYFIKVAGADDNTFGRYELELTGPEQNSGYTGDWTTDNLILSWYDAATPAMYIAGASENSSTGNVSITTFQKFGNIIRGSFTATLKKVDGTVLDATVANGYFNIIRSE